MWLTIEAGAERGKRVPVAGTRLVIGRDEGCDLVLHDEQVSRRHACLDVLDDGRAVLRNLASRNGTWVDGISVSDSLVLAGGEEIRLGSTVLRTSLGESAADAAPARKARGVDETRLVAASDTDQADEETAASEGAPVAPGVSQSMVQRVVYAVLADEVKGIRQLTRKGIIIRGIGAATGSATVAILWRILS